MAKFKGEQRFPKNVDIIRALQEAIHKYSIEAVAMELNKNLQHFYEELNPHCDQRKAKIGLDDAIEASRIIDCAVWLEMMAVELGFHLTPIHSRPDKNTVPEELSDDLEHLGQFSKVCRAPESSEQEIRAASQALRKEIRQTEELAVKKRRERKVGLLGQAASDVRQ